MAEETRIDKNLKRFIYAKPQSILITFPPGLGDVAAAEVESILSDIWFSNKFTSKVTLLKSAIRVDQIHMFAVMELLLRGKCFSDLRLIIHDGSMPNMQAAEQALAAVKWDLYLGPAMSVRLNVNVGANPALHEGKLEQILAEMVADKVREIADGGALLHLDVYKQRSVLSVSLAGELLYKRGYKSILSKSAPLREDIAAACIEKALQFGLQNNPEFNIDTLLVPFSGTGTFLIEHLMSRYNVSPCLLGRRYSIQDMPLFRAETFDYLLKQAKQCCSIAESVAANYYAIDTSANANRSLIKAVENFQGAMHKQELAWSGVDESQCPIQEDFLKMDIPRKFSNLSGNIFIPMNPPYGLRLGKNDDAVALYAGIARQVNQLAAAGAEDHVLGFILCPSEKVWSVFCKNLKKAKVDSYHINQGGLDIRVVTFYI